MSTKYLGTKKNKYQGIMIYNLWENRFKPLVGSKQLSMIDEKQGIPSLETYIAHLFIIYKTR